MYVGEHAWSGIKTVSYKLFVASFCWPHSVSFYGRFVYAKVLTLYGAVLGVIDTTQGCHPSDSSEAIDNPFIFPGTLFEGLKVGIAACILSLFTNLFATLLVAYKAWYVRAPNQGQILGD